MRSVSSTAPVPPGSPEREDSVVVPAHDGEPADGERLGAVPLREDERAQRAVLGAGVVGIVQLGDACEDKAMHTWLYRRRL